MKKFRLIRSCLVFTFPAIFILLLTSCEHSFHPINKDHNLNFSIYAVLDLSADTQWVRVMPIRDSILTSPEPIDATVSLTRISTGETVVLEDSLFQTLQGKYVWNFWTDTALLEGEEYRVQADASDGQYSRGFTTIPMGFEDPLVEYNGRDQTGRIIIDSSVKKIVVAQIIYSFLILYDTGDPVFIENYRISHLDNLQEDSNGNYQIIVDDVPEIAAESQVDPEQISLISGEITIVSGSPNWPDSLYNESSGTINNIENGMGYITGAVSKRLTLIPD